MSEPYLNRGVLFRSYLGSCWKVFSENTLQCQRMRYKRCVVVAIGYEFWARFSENNVLFRLYLDLHWREF